MSNGNVSQKTKVSKLIVQALWLKGKTQKDLATELNIPVSSVSAMLNGRYNPSVKRLHAISKILDLDIEQLVKTMFEE